jgi:hypothetical protein
VPSELDAFVGREACFRGSGWIDPSVALVSSCVLELAAESRGFSDCARELDAAFAEVSGFKVPEGAAAFSFNTLSSVDLLVFDGFLVVIWSVPFHYVALLAVGSLSSWKTIDSEPEGLPKNATGITKYSRYNKSASIILILRMA